MEDAPRLLEILKLECLDTWIRFFYDINDLKLCFDFEDLVVFLNEICMDTHLLVSCGKDSSKEFYWNWNWRKYRTGNAYLFTQNKDYSYRSM